MAIKRRVMPRKLISSMQYTALHPGVPLPGVASR